MILETLAAPPFYKNGFVVGCERTRQAVVIDPGDEVVELLEAVRRHQLDVRFILLDSLLATNITPGQLGQSQRTWLSEYLDAQTAKPAVVFVHHNPDPEKDSALVDANRLLERCGEEQFILVLREAVKLRFDDQSRFAVLKAAVDREVLQFGLSGAQTGNEQQENTNGAEQQGAEPLVGPWLRIG